MNNESELIAQLVQLHLDNEKRITLNEQQLDVFKVESRERHEALMYWLTKPWWRKLFGLK